MTTAGFDPVKFKAMQRTNWNGVSAGWSACQDDFESGGAAVTRRLLDLGGVGAGRTVLDIGTGIGEPALSASRLVGPTGRVVGLDLSPDMITIAARRTAGVDNLEFVVGDVENLDFPPGSFDVVLSRWGLMFAVDHMAVFGNIAGVLAPGGVLAAAVWSGPLTDAPMISLGYQALAARLDLPPVVVGGGPGPFSMGDRDQLAGELAQAGFTDIEVTPFVAPFLLESPQRYVAFNKAASPPSLKTMVRDRYGSEDDPATWAAVAASVDSHRNADGRVALPSKALLIRATTPSP